MTQDPLGLTFKNVALTIEGVIYVPDPAGSYAVGPTQEPLFLDDVLAEALRGCGLETAIPEVIQAVRDVAKPRFEPEITRLEQLRMQLTGSD